MRRPALVLSSVAVAAALVASSAVPADAAVPLGRSALRVYSTGSHGAVVPASIRPGMIHIRNIGRDDLLILRATHRRSTRHLAAEDLRSGSLHRLESNFRLLGIAVPGHDAYQQMTSGTFLFVDVDARHLEASKIGRMRVEGSRVDAAVPSSRRVLVTRHKQLHVPFRLPRKTWLRVGNRSSALTSFLFIGVAKRATYKMVAKATAHPSLFNIFRLSSYDFVPLSFVGPHNGEYLRFHARPGRYIAMVFAQSGDNDFPTLHHGQVRHLRVK